jgi:diadenosine tetraphosphate (Ap4A) HIT family hydrolase
MKRTSAAGRSRTTSGRSAEADRTLVQFHAKFRLPELEIRSNIHWTWSIRPEQPTLGAGVLSLRRPCAHFADIDAAEGAALADIVSEIETGLRRAFAPDHINYLMLMMVDHHVHFHVLPRYGRPIILMDQQWLDCSWPGPPDISEDANRGGAATLLHLRALLAPVA